MSATVSKSDLTFKQDTIQPISKYKVANTNYESFASLNNKNKQTKKKKKKKLNEGKVINLCSHNIYNLFQYSYTLS